MGHVAKSLSSRLNDEKPYTQSVKTTKIEILYDVKNVRKEGK